MNPRGTVLVVDDERTLARAIKAYLAEAGYEAEVAGDGETAVELLPQIRPDVVFADVRLPGMNGIDLLRRIREFDPAIPVIVMTAYGTIEGAVEAVKLGAFDYMKKPVDLEELKLLADRAPENAVLKQELSYYRRRWRARFRRAEFWDDLPDPGTHGPGATGGGASRAASSTDYRRNRQRERPGRPDSP